MSVEIFSFPTETIMLAFLDSPKRPAPPHTANIEIIKAIITNQRVGAKDFKFFLIDFNIFLPQSTST